MVVAGRACIVAANIGGWMWMSESTLEFHVARLGNKLVILCKDGYELTSWEADEWDENHVEIINAIQLVDEDPEALVAKYYDKSWGEVKAERDSPEWQTPNISEEDPLQMSVKITDAPEFTFEFTEIGDINMAVEQAKVQAVSALIHSMDEVEFELDFSNGLNTGGYQRTAKSPKAE